LKYINDIQTMLASQNRRPLYAAFFDQLQIYCNKLIRTDNAESFKNSFIGILAYTIVFLHIK